MQSKRLIGYIWFATRGGGLSRFDGLHFTNFRKEDKLPANNILSLEINGKGMMYIGTPFGLSIYDGKNTRFVKTSNPGPYTVRAVISDLKGQVFALCNSNQIGYLAGDTLHFLKKKGAERISFFSDMSVNNQAELMVASYSGEIFEVSPKQLTCRFRIPEGIVLRSILFDSKDSLWLGTEQGLFRVSTKQVDIQRTDLELISKEVVSEMTETESGDVWMGLSAGAMRYSKGQMQRFGAQNGFTNFAITSLLEDREGNIWLATDG